MYLLDLSDLTFCLRIHRWKQDHPLLPFKRVHHHHHRHLHIRSRVGAVFLPVHQHLLQERSYRQSSLDWRTTRSTLVHTSCVLIRKQGKEREKQAGSEWVKDREPNHETSSRWGNMSLLLSFHCWSLVISFFCFIITSNYHIVVAVVA